MRTAGEAGQVAWRIPAASAAGIVRSGPGAGRDVREWETDILCASEPDGLAAGAGALPGARRRCEAGKRTHGPGQRACLALLAATALLALAAPAQAQTEIWSATLTPGDLSSGILGCSNGFSIARCSSTSVLSEDSFNYDSTDYNITVLFLRPDGRLQFQVDDDITTATAALTLVVGSTALVLADAPTILSDTRIWNSSGVSLTVGTAINVKLTAAASTNTAPTVANTIPNQTATAGTAFSYAFLANTFADTDPGDTLTYTATQSDDTALPSWLSFAAATRTFSGTPTAADVGTVSVKVTASDGHGGSVSDTFDIVVSAAANTLATGAPTITGTAQVGQTLTAGTTAIMDADGLTSVSYTYQWIGVATDNTETNIASATASTYTLEAADQGTTVKVTVSFTDDANNPETLTSAATATVSAAANTLATGAPTITGTAQVGQTLTAGTTAIMDADGLTSVSYTYQWIRVATDNTETNISSATASTYILVAADLGTTLTVRVTFADDLGHTETRTSAATATVTATPAVPTREPFEVDIVGVPEVAVAGESYELTAQSDEDSLVYAWRVDSGAIEPDDVQMVVWTAPETAGVAWIHVDVTREDGAKAGQSAYVRVEVPEPEPEPVPALPLLGQLLLALGLAGAGAMRLVRAARRP